MLGQGLAENKQGTGRKKTGTGQGAVEMGPANQQPEKHGCTARLLERVGRGARGTNGF